MIFPRQPFQRAAGHAAWLLAVTWLAAGCGKSNQPPTAVLDAIAKHGKISSPASDKTNAAPASPTNSVAATDEFKSVFEDRLKGGKDPFFPLSVRTSKDPSKTGGPKIPLAPPVLVLKGITGKSPRLFALINNVVLAVGEEQNVRVSTNSVMRVRLLSINDKEQSVTVKLEGEEPKEIRFETKKSP